MAIQSGKRQQEFNEINITPLTDIFLVLLIIMMVIAPTFQNIDQEIEMPEINSGLAVEEKQVNVAITKEGSIFVNQKQTTTAELVAELTRAKEQTEEKSVVVQADKMTKNKEVIAVMQAAQAAGFEKLTIAGEPLSKTQQRELQGQPQPTKESE